MNKITIFNENYVYLEMIYSINIINIYLNKYTLKPMDKEDEKLIQTIANLLLNRVILSEDYYFYLYKMVVESEFRYM